MNERCKEALYHSWGKAPERKKLERDYNRNYYQKNKYKWGVKGANVPDDYIGPKPKKPTAADYALTGVGYVMTAMPGANYLYDSPQQYADYLKEDISIAKKFVKKIGSVGASVANASKNAVKKAKKFLDSLNFVKKWKQFIKEGQDYMDEHY